jgi:cell volume regulation protein A
VKILSNITFILAGLIIILGFIGSYLFTRRSIPDNLILIFFGIILGPMLKFVDPSGFSSLAPVFSSLALIIILLDGGMNLNLYKVLEESPKALILGFLNVLISMAITTAYTSILLNWSLLHGLLLGIIVGGTSSSIILSFTQKLNASERVNTLLNLESVFTDAIVIVVSITILDIIVEAKQASLISVAQSIVSALSIGAVFGLIWGIFWLKILSILKDDDYDDILTLSVTLLFFGVTEMLGGNGAIFALVFGLVLGNGDEIGGMLRIEGFVDIGSMMRKFMNQMSFFIRTFFFVYLGLILFIENRMMILYSVGLSLILLFGRYLGTVMTSWRDEELQQNGSLIALMMPRGLAAAIMAQLVATSGIMNATLFPDMILIVIITSVLISSIGTSYLRTKTKKQQQGFE